MNQQPSRLHAVDLMRGLAILFVLLNHVNMRLRSIHVPYAQGLPDQLVASLVWNGQRGVQMFFAISGFLITSTSLRRWKSFDNVSVARFYRIRFARIAPLLAALLTVLTILHLSGISHYVVSEKTGGLSRALIAAATFHINVLEARRGYLPGNWDILWSLSVEEMFYLFFPVVCVLFSPRKLLVPLLGIFVVLGPVARTVWSAGNEVWHEYSYLGGMDAIALGCLTAMFMSRYRLDRTAAIVFTSTGVLLLCVSLCLTIPISHGLLGRSGLDMTLIAVETCLIAAADGQTHWTTPRLLTPLRGLGRLSYEVYLTHMFVVFLLFDLFVRTGNALFAVPVLFVCVIALAGGLGRVVAQFYSEPMNRRLRGQFATSRDVEAFCKVETI